VELDVSLSVGQDKVDLSCVPFVEDGKDKDQANQEPGNNRCIRLKVVLAVDLFATMNM
jgi:hypothetical protein